MNTSSSVQTHSIALSIVWVALGVAICWATPFHANAQPAPNEAQSCQAFVQKFYDWYWNSVADQADQAGFHPTRTLDDVVKLKPPVLGPELLKLLKREARTSGGIGGLGIDPFLSGPLPHGRYTVSEVFVGGDGCRATIPAGHEIAELRKAGAGWVFVDFHYSFYYQDGTKRQIPDADLIELLTS